MAGDDSDDSQKTEEPTQRRLDDAREKGQVVSSKDLNHWFIILAATIVVAMFGPAIARDLARRLGAFLEQSHAIVVDHGGVARAFAELLEVAAFALVGPIAILVVAALATGVLQHGIVFSTEPIRPKLEKISILAGFKRIFSGRSVVEFVKGIAKIAIVGAVGAAILWPELAGFEALVQTETIGIAARTYDLVVRLLIGVVAVLTALAILDYLYQRHQFLKQMRMSRQELRDEFKQTEGDPQVKGRIRQLRQERARQRMMAKVPEASVVVTNPTHYAIALRYEQATMTAPVVVAKGVDSLALRIREIAREHEIPIVENPPLAQALYATVDLDEEVPPQHYKAVAEVISYVYRLKNRVAGAAGGGRPAR